MTKKEYENFLKIREDDKWLEHYLRAVKVVEWVKTEREITEETALMLAEDLANWFASDETGIDEEAAFDFLDQYEESKEE
jgi:hypothetical protein